MPTRQAGVQTRLRLLEAASRIILAHGITGLTLDAVAHEASVSKGGLLHHFPSKEALIGGLIRQLQADFDARVQAQFNNEESDRPGRWLRAYIRVSFEPDVREKSIGAALSIAVAKDSTLINVLRESSDSVQQQAENDGLPPARATLIRIAADGVWMNDVLGMTPIEEPLRTQLLDELLHLTEL